MVNNGKRIMEYDQDIRVVYHARTGRQADLPRERTHSVQDKTQSLSLEFCGFPKNFPLNFMLTVTLPSPLFNY